MLAATMYCVPSFVHAGFVSEIDWHLVLGIAVDIGALYRQPQRLA